jgi:hypothetical protein
VYERALSTPFDISTATAQGVVFTTADGGPQDLVFDDDGDTAYVASADADAIREYTLSTPFDMSTASSTSITLTPEGSTDLKALAWSKDGTRLHILSDAIYEYDCSTAFDISTATYNGVSISNQGGSAGALSWDVPPKY